jgi:Copper transport outer membrane protein, MctB
VINLRYHIVSITAVFLALGIGLAFGAAFIDRATVDQLERNLNRIEDDNTRFESENARLEDHVDALADMDADLRATGLPELVAGQLANVAVVTLAVRGIDEDVVTAASGATEAAGARSAGVLWLTERFLLDEQSEIDDLAEALGVSSGTAEGLQRTVRRQLGTLLARAALPPALPPDGPTTTDPTDPNDTETSTTEVPEPAVPELVQRLVDAGFLDYDPPAAGGPPPGVFAPSSGLRVLAISGEGAVVPDDLILVPVLDQVSGGAVTGEPGPVAVAAQRGPAFDAAPPEDADPAAARVVFVGPIRDDEDLRARVSTVDDLEAYPGLVATVLALEHGASGQYGHYGIGEGAQSLLPPPVEAGEAPG